MRRNFTTGIYSISESTLTSEDKILSVTLRLDVKRLLQVAPITYNIHDIRPVNYLYVILTLSITQERCFYSCCRGEGASVLPKEKQMTEEDFLLFELGRHGKVLLNERTFRLTQQNGEQKK